MLGAAMLVVLASVPLAGGRLGALAEIRFQQSWTIPLALAVQILITTVVPEGAGALHSAAHLGSYALAAVFLFANRHLPGMWLIAFGAGLNLLVITANGGVMPADPGALGRAGLPTESGEFENSTVLKDPRLPFLGDVFAVPEPLPFANVFSLGDIVLVVGALVTLHRICGSRLALSRAGAKRPRSEDGQVSPRAGTPGSGRR